jgi:hypothetical protein
MVEESSMVDLEYPEPERTGPYIPEIYKANSSYEKNNIGTIQFETVEISK